MATSKKPVKRTTNKSFGRELYSDVKGVVKEHPFISLVVGYKAATYLTTPKVQNEEEKPKSIGASLLEKFTDGSALIIIGTIAAVTYLYKNI